MITIKEFPNYINANIAANYLRQNEIECFLADENISRSVCPMPTNTRLMVSEEDADRAKDLLDLLERK